MTENPNPSKYLGNELEYLRRVLDAESWSATGGRWTNALENEFARRFGVKYAVAFNSGTSTLHAALVAAGVKPGDEVISPALTVIMDTTATLHANAVPVYADVDAATFTIDPADIERKITPRTKAIITVALYGLAPDMNPIIELAKEHGIVVIEDNAQSMLSTYQGRLLGTIGDMASYSFETTKHISCGEGGMVITDNEAYAEAVRKIGGHGFRHLRADEGRVRLNQDHFQSPDYKRHDTLGWNYRLSEFNAAVALAQFERVDELVDMRTKSADILMDAMASCDYLLPQETPEEFTNTYYTLGVSYRGDEAMGVSWQDFRRAYIDEGGDGIYGAWSVPYLEPLMAERRFVDRCPWVYQDVDYAPGLCPVAERLQPTLMQFKTNYRDLSLARERAQALRRTIKRFSAR